MPETPILGLGELVVDAHYSATSDGDRVYVGSRGGGSVWNILVNAASLGASTAAVSVGGDDWRHDLALSELEAFGVRNYGNERVARKPTAVMHHFAVTTGVRARASRYITTSQCPVCVRRPAYAILRDDEDTLSSAANVDLPAGFFVVDRITNLRSRWAEELAARGWLSVVDIGYPGYLRFANPEILRSSLRSFRLIVLQKSVAAFLLSRFSVDTVDRVAERLANVIIVSDGKNGLALYDGRHGEARSSEIPADEIAVVDTVGAGDRLLGALLANLSAWSSRRSSKPGLPGEGFMELEFTQILAMAQEAVRAVPVALLVVGARGHLEIQKPTEFGPRVGQTVTQLRELIGASCPICGSIPVARTNRAKGKVGANNLAKLEQRVLGAISNPRSIAVCREVLSRPLTTVVCGTGGSLPAAQLIADVFTTYTSELAVALRPLDVLLRTPSAKRVVGVSYSGFTSDTLRAMEKMKLMGAEAVLVTAADLENLSNTPFIVIPYGRSKGGSTRRSERGFVSIGATVVPAALWAAAATDIDVVTDVVAATTLPAAARLAAEQLVEVCAARGNGLAVIGSGWAMSAMLDLESKFAEAGLGFLSVHESKDFSHGRFMSVVGERANAGGVLILGVGPETEYDKHMSRALRDLTEVRELRSSQPGVLGGLELLIAVQHFADEYGDRQAIDIGKPGSVAPEMASLYRWSMGLVPDDI